MSIKDLFDKGHSLKFVKNKTQDDIREDLESPRYIDAYSEKRARFVPDVDFTTASNFARFGLAEEYYDQAIKRIYQTYPYDGSRAEKIEWENNSTYLELFLFENEYPRTNGFVTFNGTTSTRTETVPGTAFHFSSSSPEYITFAGGPHADSGGDYKSEFSAGPSKTGISKANVYHTASQRTSNLEFDLDKGVTVEFWMKKDGFESTSYPMYEYIFSNYSVSAINSEYFTIQAIGNLSQYHFFLTIFRSSEAAFSITLDTGLTSIADGVFHHYAITLKKSGTKTIANIYVDGAHVERVESADTVSAFTGSLNGTIGASGHLTTGITKGLANIVSSSFDEFRYWKTERDAQQIGRYYRDQIGGGTNTDNVKYDDVTNKVDLGVYFKFNEGITGNSSTDTAVLDYSGRISNGTFVNYGSASRSTGSAIVLSNAATKEFKDPIIYSSHPDVSALATRYQLSGAAHDHENAVSIYKSVPGWILEEDEKESNHLKQLTQVLASYFDDLYLQIEKLPRLKDINYPDDTSYEKPLPFADRLLSSRGYEPPELFAHASAMAKYLERGERKLFEKKLYEVKNIIYQNIYNNLSYIQKSKGTYKSLRNFLRCFGVDQELVKLNIYANDDVYEFKDNYTNTSVQKRYLDFDDYSTRITASDGTTGAFGATAYQYYDSTDTNSLSYIPRDTDVMSQSGSVASRTYEVEVFFPKRSIKNDVNYGAFPSITSSIFGVESVANSNTDLTYAASNVAHFNVVAIKSDDDKRNVKFAVVTSSGGGNTTLDNELFTPNSYKGVYDNEKWNLAFRIAPTKGAKDGNINPDPMHRDLTENTGSLLSPSGSAYTYELYGVNYISNILQNEFTISGTMSAIQAVNIFSPAHQRFFAGAKRTNFTGSIERYSDVKVSSCRVWNDYIPNEAIKAHARDASNYGVLHPYGNINDNVEIGGARRQPAITSLLLHWDMSNVTGSNASGRFQIPDVASGSTDAKLKFGDDWTAPYTNYNYTGRGDFFVTDSNYRDQAVDIEFVQTAKQKLPEVVNSDDMVKILNKQDDVVFTRDTTYVQHLLSVEKSMYQIISEEMLRIFATIVDFNNLVGEPVNRYRPHYKKMEKLRELYFERIENDTLDLEKFIEYFKWVDDAVSIMIAQLIPISSNAVELLRNMVESHILERNKYWTKFPTLETKPHNPIASLKGIEELKYNWKFGHAPVSAAENTNQDTSCLWWKQRADRDGVLTSGDSTIDSQKTTLLKLITTEVSGAGPTLKTPAGVKYAGTYYNNRSLARPVDLVSKRSLSLKGGSNPDNNNIHEFYKGVTKWASDDDFIYLDVDNRIQETVCNDQDTPPELDKKEFRMKALVMTAEEISGSTASGEGAFDKQYTDAKSSLLLPFNMYSSSVDAGYRSLWSSNCGIDFTNMHDDKYGPHAEIPLQGPFTEKYVGGSQHRHIKLNQGVDSLSTRAEGWRIQEFLAPSTANEYLVYALSTIATGNNIDFVIPSTDVSVIAPASSDGSQYPPNPDPSPTDLWRNGIGADNSWSFVSGSTPSAGTGPATGLGSGYAGYAYCEVLPSKVGQTFSLVTPLLDFLEVDSDSDMAITFYYHMHGLHIGSLKLQASQDPNFETGVADILVQWSAGSPSTNAFALSGQQHRRPTDNWTLAAATDGMDTTLASFRGQRFYLRFLYTAGIGHLGDCAIAEVSIYKNYPYESDSFKLLSSTYDSVHRPPAIRMRDEYAKRPVNIRNIQMTGSSPTKAGNYLDRYEYVSVMSEQNDPWFITNVDSLKQTTAMSMPGAYPRVYTYGEITVLTSTASELHGKLILLESTHPAPQKVIYISNTSGQGATGDLLAVFGYTIAQINGLSSAADFATQIRLAINHPTLFGAEITVNQNVATLVLTQKGSTAAKDMSTTADAEDLRIVQHEANVGKQEFRMPDRTYISGTTRNRTRFVNRFSSPGGYEVMSRGFLDPAHETYSVYNAMPYRNLRVRQVYNSQLQAHQGAFGVSGHSTSTARVYGSETAGTIQAADYTISGDASRHKYHRNNVERMKVSVGAEDFDGATLVTASIYDNAFVSHMIPRTDNQTRWITASLI